MRLIFLLLGLSLFMMPHIKAEDLDNDQHNDTCSFCHDSSVEICNSDQRQQHRKLIKCHHIGEDICILAILVDKEIAEAGNLCRLDIEVNQPLESDNGNLATMASVIPMRMESIKGEMIEENAIESDIEESPDDKASASMPEVVMMLSTTEPPEVGVTEDIGDVEVKAAKAEEANDKESKEKEIQEDEAIAEEQPLQVANELSPEQSPEMPDDTQGYQADAPEMTNNVEVADETATDHIEGTEAILKPLEEEQNAPEQPDHVAELTTESGILPLAAEVTVRVPTGDLLRCYECSSAGDKQCVKKPSKKIQCRAAEGQKNGCYTLMKDDHLERGCLNALDRDTLEQCAKSNSCLLCSTHNCNNISWPSCYSCLSNASHPECTWPQLISPSSTQTLCPSPDDLCYIQIDTNFATVRGCIASTDTPQCDASAFCHLCNETLCNGAIFPPTRRRCHQCRDNTQCAEAQLNASAALPCPLYQPDEGCFYFLTFTGQMQRGCQSMADQFEQCLSTDRCVSCNDEDACNGAPLMRAPSLSCSLCDSRLPHSDPVAAGCAWAQSMETVKPCVNQYLYYLKQSCQMIYAADMELAVRGCSLDMGVCEASNEWCEMCESEACNTGNMRWEYCVQCRSDEVESCGDEAQGIKPTMCKAEVQPYAMRGCYASKNTDTNVTSRGCITDLTDDGFIYCQQNTKLCSLCYESGCNNQLAPNSAASSRCSVAFNGPMPLFIAVTLLLWGIGVN